MEQAITDYVKFLADAGDAMYRLSCDQNAAGQLANEEERKGRELEATRKTVVDSVNQTIRKRLDEANSSYNREIEKGQERLKKTRAKREKAKSQGMKERIAKETSELREHNRDLKVQLKTLFQKNRAPARCGAIFHYALHYPRGFKETMILLPTLIIFFLGIPCDIYFLIPQGVIWHLAAVYFAGVLLFGGVYVMIGDKTRLRHQDTLKRGRDIRNALRSGQKKMKVIIKTTQRDGNEDIYNLEKYGDEIACVEQELSEIASKKKDALSTFENVIKTITSDKIVASHKENLDRLKQELDQVSADLRSLEGSIKEQNIRITDTYGPYLGRELLRPGKLVQLSRFIQDGSAFNITEAIKMYRDVGQDER